MINKNAIDTSDELCLEFKNHGVKLIKPELHTNLEKPVRMADVLRLPFNVYFLDKNSVVQNSNEQHASTLGFSSPQQARGTDIFDICVYHSAQRTVCNDRCIIQNKSAGVQRYEKILFSLKKPRLDMNVNTRWAKQPLSMRYQNNRFL